MWKGLVDNATQRRSFCEVTGRNPNYSQYLSEDFSTSPKSLQLASNDARKLITGKKYVNPNQTTQ